jgi:dTDP-4-dehydrorhamnose reductase
MKVLFFGGNGWIGSKFLAYVNANHSDISIICAKSRADLCEDVRREILEHQPTHVISFIGRTHGEGINTIDYLEQPGKLVENIRDNLYGPMVLANLCKKYGIHLTYLGTGCIFSSEDPTAESFADNDVPNFFGSSYSIVKGYTDRLMHMYEHVLNLRIRMPITSEEHPRNFITKIASYPKICSIPNSMTVLDDMFPVIVDMLKKEQTGTYNMVNQGLIAHNEILEMYKEIVDPSKTWVNMTLDEQDGMLKSKRSNNQLSTDKLYTDYPGIPNITTSVRNCLEKMKRK